MNMVVNTMNIWKPLRKNRVLAGLSLSSTDLARLADEMDRTEQYADLYHIDAADAHSSPHLFISKKRR